MPGKKHYPADDGPITKAGPIIHLLVEAERIGKLQEDSQVNARLLFDDTRYTIEALIGAAIAKAYREGLRDGFMQGALAEAKSRAEVASNV